MRLILKTWERRLFIKELQLLIFGIIYFCYKNFLNKLIMKKIFSSTFIFLFVINSYGQKSKTYYSLTDALKNPLKVYTLNLNHSELLTLPEDIGKLINLKTLSLTTNQLMNLQ